MIFIMHIFPSGVNLAAEDDAKSIFIKFISILYLLFIYVPVDLETEFYFEENI